MPPPSDPRLLVLHGLQLKGNARPRRWPTRSTSRWPTSSASCGRWRPRGWSSSARAAPPGGVSRRRGARRSPAWWPPRSTPRAPGRPSPARTTASRALNAAVLDACSRWQVRDVAGSPVLNDHRDAAYDAGVVADLARIQRRADPVVDDLAGTLARYRAYGPRLRRAVEHVEAGDGDWFTKPSLPSYHTVWFELHEDLLSTLGLDRSAESPSAGADDGADTGRRRRRPGRPVTPRTVIPSPSRPPTLERSAVDMGTARFGKVLTAMVTPFHDDGSLDLDGAAALARWLVAQGNDGLVLAGTTGEAPTLSDDEKVELWRAVRAAVDVPLLAGAGSNDTRHTIGLSERAAETGVDGLLLVSPYYNRPTQAGLEAHFERWPRRPTYRSWSTTSRCGPGGRSRSTRWCASPTRSRRS